jgi:hypothetical protein
MSVDLVLLILTAVVVLVAVVGLSAPMQRRRVERRIGRMQDPAEGTLEVTAASAFVATGGAQNASYSLSGVLHVGGLAPTRVELKGVATSTKWPQPGDALPVTADRRLPTEVVIHWNRVPTRKQRARMLAADRARQEGAAATGEPPAAGTDEQRPDGPAPAGGAGPPSSDHAGKSPSTER